MAKTHPVPIKSESLGWDQGIKSNGLQPNLRTTAQTNASYPNDSETTSISDSQMSKNIGNWEPEKRQENKSLD